MNVAKPSEDQDKASSDSAHVYKARIVMRNPIKKLVLNSGAIAIAGAAARAGITSPHGRSTPCL